MSGFEDWVSNPQIHRTPALFLLLKFHDIALVNKV